jgi:hypothetical protein
MNAQELCTDLATAERNMRLRSMNYSLIYFNKVEEAFSNTRATSFLDLVESDVRLALHLREVAIQEQLL